jgi:hypothetical protein
MVSTRGKNFPLPFGLLLMELFSIKWTLYLILYHVEFFHANNADRHETPNSPCGMRKPPIPQNAVGMTHPVTLGFNPGI